MRSRAKTSLSTALVLGLVLIAPSPAAAAPPANDDVDNAVAYTAVPFEATQDTTEATAATIRSNLHKSPMYSGVIEGVGPRYCPSIEDKIAEHSSRSPATTTREVCSRASRSPRGPASPTT